VYGENETFLLIENRLLHSGGDNGISSEQIRNHFTWSLTLL